jgi:NAD(P)-dependent dehydrogenase (short-subunit alcohol dehydrogenase family)
MRTIIITGSNGSLGKVVVDKLAAEDYRIIADVGPGDVPDSLKEKVHELTNVDLTIEDDTENYAQSLIDRYPDIDAALLLTGGFEPGTIDSTNEDLLDRMIGLNFKTAWFIVKPFMTHFKKTGKGQFILMSARTAINPVEGKNNIAYAISKSMLLSLSEIINSEGKQSGITASVILPSILDTLQNREAMPDADFDNWVSLTSVAELISFILSDAGRKLRQPVFKVYNRS